MAAVALCCAWPAAAQEQPTSTPSDSTHGLAGGNPDGGPGASSVSNWNDYRSPTMARRLSGWFTLGPVLGGLTMVVVAAQGDHNTPIFIAGLSNVVFGLTLGPSVGYAYSGEHGRGWGIGALRLIALVAGTLGVVAASFCIMDCQDKDTTGPAVFEVTLLAGIVSSAIYDIVKAPDAARRSNVRHSLTNLSLVPVVAPSGPAPHHGLALAGRF
jgi:hypothetical protein